MAKTKKRSARRSTGARSTPGTKIRIVGGKVHYGSGGRALCSTKGRKGAHATTAKVDCSRCLKLAKLNRAR